MMTFQLTNTERRTLIDAIQAYRSVRMDETFPHRIEWVERLSPHQLDELRNHLKGESRS